MAICDNFAWVTKLINTLTRKNIKWQWGQEQQRVFNELKGIFMTRPVLAFPDLDKKLRVKANISNYTTREVLLIKCSNELWRPVAVMNIE